MDIKKLSNQIGDTLSDAVKDNVNNALAGLAHAKQQDSESDDPDISDDDDDLPPELQKYEKLLEAVEEGDWFAVARAAAPMFLPKILLGVAVIVICFFVKWWLGIIAIVGAIAYVAYACYSMYNKFEKYF